MRQKRDPTDKIRAIPLEHTSMGNASRRPSFAYCRSAAAIRSPWVTPAAAPPLRTAAVPPRSDLRLLNLTTSQPGLASFPFRFFSSCPLRWVLEVEKKLFGFRRQEAAIPRTVEEFKGKSVMEDRGGVGQYPPPPRTRSGFFKLFSNPSQTRLIKFNPVPLGEGRGGYPKKPAPLSSLFVASVSSK